MAPSLVEVLPGKLHWAPEHATAPAGFEGELKHALDLVMYTTEGDRKAFGTGYNVMHYSAKAAGRAFGPLGIDIVLRFCRGLRTRLANDSRPLAVGTAPDDPDQRSNIAVIFGAYLLLVGAWSVDDIAAKLGASDAEAGFVVSWARKDRPEPKRNMTVRDCWDGLAMGLKMGWIDAGCLESDTATDYICKKWREWVATYDCSWVIPGFIVVGADPTTTALDPNPSTFKQVFPADTPTTAASTETGVQLEFPDGEVKKGTSASDVKRVNTPGSGASAGSLHSVCKEYRTALDAAPLLLDSKPLDFMTFMKNIGVSTMVRTNFHNEPGMPPNGGYDANKLKAYGIGHVDILIVDMHGGLPKRLDVQKLLKTCPNGRTANGAVYIHCKGGFGRSIVLACCLAIERLDIPGAALLGWVRMVRPGCVNTPQQELMLKGFKGSKDVRRFAALPPGGEDESPKCGCTLQ